MSADESDIESFDVVVVGVGSAGHRAAAAAHEEGARVLAVDGSEAAGRELGGLCILRGCMPTKTLLETAHRLHDIRDAERFGIKVGEPELDFAAHMARMRSLVARFQRAKVGGLTGADWELAQGSVRFEDPHTLVIDGSRRVRARTIVLSTGSKVRPLPVRAEAGVTILDSDDMFQLEAPPESIAVLGTGAVGIEFAQWLARIGSRVTLIGRSPLLHRLDIEAGKELALALGEEMSLHVPVKTAKILATENGRARVEMVESDGTEHSVAVECVLNATGRVPNFDGLGLDEAGITVGVIDTGDRERGGTFQSETPHVFVAGDATGETLILHEANLEGKVAGANAARLARGESELKRYDRGIPPAEVIFSDPVAASCGRTLAQCEEDGLEVRDAVKRFPQQGRGIVTGTKYGFIRLIATRDTGRIVGCQILGPHAEDLIQIPIAVMAFKGTAADMVRMPWYHPTLAEAFIEVARPLAV